MKPTKAGAWCAVAMASVALLIGCGGGDGKGQDTLSAPDQSELAGPVCTTCQPGVVTGLAASGAPLAEAQVRLLDASGQQVQGLTDAQGRFNLPIGALQGPVIVQVIGEAGGQAMVLHSVVQGNEVGRRFIQVTPLTELITARALGGMPADLLLQDRVNAQRLSASALADAERQVEALVRPVLDLAGVGTVDLRLSPLSADGTGLDRALDLIVLIPQGQGHRLRALWQAPEDALNIVAGAADPGRTLTQADTSTAQALASALDSAPAQIRARFDALQALLATALPSDSALEPFLSTDFLHAGLDRSAHIQRVLLRNDPVHRGGYSLVGARFDQVRVLRVHSADRIWVSWRVKPRAPFEAHDETMWLSREGGTWRLQGDGQAARLRVRHALSLLARPMGETAVLGLPGATCPSSASDGPCRIAGGQAGLPSGGHLDLGTPASGGGDDHFGLLALFRSQASTAEERLQAHIAHNQLLATPSAAVQAHLLFELDARQTAPQARRAVVTGPGLPAGGVTLLRPTTVAGLPEFDHWALAQPSDTDTASEDWHGVPDGWCAGREASSCATDWARVGLGSTYRVELFDAQDQSLGQAQAALPMRPAPAGSAVSASDPRFGRWQMTGTNASPLTLNWLLGPSVASGDALFMHAPWSPPAAPGARPVRMDLAWHRAGFPPTFGEEVHREVVPIEGVTSAPWDINVPARSGWRSTWLVLRLTSTDRHGNRYIHVISPSNPH